MGFNTENFTGDIFHLKVNYPVCNNKYSGDGQKDSSLIYEFIYLYARVFFVVFMLFQENYYKGHKYIGMKRKYECFSQIKKARYRRIYEKK